MKILDILKQLNLPIRDSNKNLFNDDFYEELKPHLKELKISKTEDFLNQLTIETSLQKIKSHHFKKSKYNFKFHPITNQEANNLVISYHYYQTKFGQILIGSTNIGICYLAFETNEKPALPYLKEIYPNGNFKIANEKFHQTVLDFIEGKVEQEITFHLKGTSFQLDVWKTLLEIPMGSLTSYGEIAKKINKPKAFRAVGTAIGKNPISVLIPCHRVIQTNGNFGGYMWGLPTKFLLIGWEGLYKQF